MFGGLAWWKPQVLSEAFACLRLACVAVELLLALEEFLHCFGVERLERVRREFEAFEGLGLSNG